MSLHGVAQTAPNGSRIFLHRQYLRWNVFIPFTIGSFPFLGLLIPRNINLEIERKPIAFVCGIIVTAKLITQHINDEAFKKAGRSPF